MSNDINVSVRDVHKTFRISHSGITSLKTLLLSKHHAEVSELYVLKGVSFDVKKGECLGIVGRNGAGKSTLLSLLARIYKPTSGTIQINGRLAPLLELGSGFHPELTGLENIVVAGLILGFSKKAIEKRVDAIVAFAELEQYIDSPVRTYSSGMQARLGFAINVHVDAEVLLVDEVLAVGDFAFRAKCEKKVKEVRGDGRTIILVSHNASEVLSMSDRCLWLQEGRIEMEGDPKTVTDAYIERSVSALAENRQEPV